VSVHLYIAPAATGKTEYVLGQARAIATGLSATPRICMPTHQQIRAARRRLALKGGALGVRLLTFDGLYAECLNAAGEIYTELSDPVQYRLIRSVVDELPLDYYAPITARPGFIRVVQELVAELKAARVRPADFGSAVRELGDEPRLRELGEIYAAYQNQLTQERWADRAGMGWLTVDSLERRATAVSPGWSTLFVDGFDSFTPVQVDTLRLFATRVGSLIVTLTGTNGDERANPIYRRFNRTRRQLEEALQIAAEPLPERVERHDRALAHLATSLFHEREGARPTTAAVELIEAPDREKEVRAALRWLKRQVVANGTPPVALALLARSITPYRSFIVQTAAEFGLPIELVDGLPLRLNPAIAAILDLLGLLLPWADDPRQPALPYRQVIETLRSPYFTWMENDVPGSAGISPADVDLLATVARWERVIGGLPQWEQALGSLAGAQADVGHADLERVRPAWLPTGERASELRRKFHHFVTRITPHGDHQRYRDWVRWLEELIGPDPAIRAPADASEDEQTSLGVVRRIREGPPEIAAPDIAALETLKDVLRGLVWAEEVIPERGPVDYERFVRELRGITEATTYRPRLKQDRAAILVADVMQARGIPFEAIAVMGLAESEFPAALQEDAFLRDRDRAQLSTQFGLALQPSLDSNESGFFYETVTRARSHLLLTRPCLADNGAPWQPSAFWEEVRRRVAVEPVQEDTPTPPRAASWPELIESLSVHPEFTDTAGWARRIGPAEYAADQTAIAVLTARQKREARGAFDGGLQEVSAELAQRFGPVHTWSASGLETYQACPFMFFIRHILGLEQRLDPEEGLDARQLGSIYHHILEALYQHIATVTGSDLASLLAVLDEVAGSILDAAPAREGFRVTAWWRLTRQEIIDNIRRSLEVLAALPGDFVPSGQELRFAGHSALLLERQGDQLRLHGVIDRADVNTRGEIRIIDYKTSGPTGYDNSALAEGKRLQVALYALAARDALHLGNPVDGFYLHVQNAKCSTLSLATYPGGVTAALQAAVEHAWSAVRGIRTGAFDPHPPSGGCPSYCPATFCWQFRPRMGG